MPKASWKVRFASRLRGAGALLALLSLVVLSDVAVAQTKWKLQTNWPPGNQLFDEVVQFAARVKVMTAGRLEIEMLPVGAVAGPNQTIETVRAGILDGHVSFSTIFSGIDPGFAPLADLPGAFDSAYQIEEFFYDYGGLELTREAYARFNMYTIGVGTGSFESVPSHVPLRSLADFKGVKLRSPPGISWNIWERLGATPVNLPQSEVFSALEKRVIDAADAGTLSFNDQIGVHAHVKYAMLNSPHSNGLFDVSVNKARWDAQPADIKAILHMAMRDLMISCIVRAAKDDAIVLAKVKEKGGLTLSELSPEDRVKYRQIAVEAWQDWGKKSPFSQKVIDAYVNYLKQIGKF